MRHHHIRKLTESAALQRLTRARPAPVPTYVLSSRLRAAVRLQDGHGAQLLTHQLERTTT